MPVTVNQRLLGSRLGFTLNGTDYWADISKWELSPESGDKKAVTFGDAASGSSAPWKLKGEAVVSFAAASFWSFIWANAGKTVSLLVSPHGNKKASETQPHFKVSVTIPTKAGMSSEAGDEEGARFPFEWPCLGEPEKITQASSTMGTGNAEDSLAS